MNCFYCCSKNGSFLNEAFLHIFYKVLIPWLFPTAYTVYLDLPSHSFVVLTWYSQSLCTGGIVKGYRDIRTHFTYLLHSKQSLAKLFEFEFWVCMRQVRKAICARRHTTLLWCRCASGAICCVCSQAIKIYRLALSSFIFYYNITHNI